MECSLCRLADSTKLRGSAGVEGCHPEGHWQPGQAHENLMKFNRAKCEVLPLGWGKLRHRLGLGDISEEISEEKSRPRGHDRIHPLQIVQMSLVYRW